MKFLRNIALAAATLLSFGTATSAATLATLDIEGGYAYELGANTQTFDLFGSFTTALLDPNLFNFDAYTFSAALSVTPDPGTQAITVFDDSFVATADEIRDFLFTLASSPFANDIADLVNYVVGNTGTPFDTPFGELTSSFTNFAPTANGITADFFLSFVNDSGGTGFQSLFTTQGGAFALNLEVASAVPAVPLPAGFPLLLAGLGGFAVMRRKQSRA